MEDSSSLIDGILHGAKAQPDDPARFPQQTLKFMDEMPGGFFIYRADGPEEILYTNTALLKIVGCRDRKEFEQLTGNSFRGLVHPDDLDAVEESIWRQIGQDQSDLDYVEYRIRRKDGTVRWLEDYGHFVTSEKYGGIFYVFVTDATDKVEHQQRERAALLRENDQKEARIRAYDQELRGLSEEHLRRMDMIEGLSVDYESIFYADLDTDLIRAYQAGAHTTASLFPPGRRHRDYRGFAAGYVERWVHPEDRAMVAAQFDPDSLRRELSGERAVHTNFRSLHNGRVEYLQLRIVSVGCDDRVSQILLGIRSVDEEIRRAMEQQEALAAALEQARTAVAAKNAFLSNMSHDMRTPLNAIAGFTMLARRHADSPEKVLRYLDMIEVSGRQLLRLISNVLEIARIESGGSRLEPAPCDLREVADQVRTSLFTQAATRNLTLSADLNGLRQPMVCADARKLKEILLHLAGNAVKYTEPGGWVRIILAGPECSSPGFGQYRLIVEDNGIGISRDFLDHIFESFSREQNTTLSGVYGTGLGLPIVKSIVEMMGGSINVKSEPRRGSCFTVTLPLRQQTAEEIAQELQPSAPRGRKILIVEDNALNMEIAQELLQDAGFETDTAENGRIGFEKIRDSAPGEYALILMDLQMPEMDGYQAAQAIRALPQPGLAHLPVVALSANAFEEDKRRALDSGMNAHMSKPIEIEQLLELIRRLTGGTDG